MTEEIIMSLISAGVAIISCLISSFIASSKAISYIEKTQAVTDTKLEELTREVRRHNNFAERMPVVEEQVKIINHRINNLEKNNGR
ncbi:MAG: hypothetical protein E7557_01630 [Ruminococcaceae bacterium]|nr:hypothetical protein [Oscillospiraceae bacterium]